MKMKITFYKSKSSYNGSIILRTKDKYLYYMVLQKIKIITKIEDGYRLFISIMS